ncbi:unnamed protein product, partial [Amoebophrya sp. A120]|eukprot:GSA120T00021606001.1
MIMFFPSGGHGLRALFLSLPLFLLHLRVEFFPLTQAEVVLGPRLPRRWPAQLQTTSLIGHDLPHDDTVVSSSVAAAAGAGAGDSGRYVNLTQFSDPQGRDLPNVLPDYDCERVPEIQFRYVVGAPGQEDEDVRNFDPDEALAGDVPASSVYTEQIDFDRWFREHQERSAAVRKLFEQKEHFVHREGEYSEALRLLLNTDEAMALRRAQM